jgi:hypothetical protein
MVALSIPETFDADEITASRKQQERETVNRVDAHATLDTTTAS